MRFEWDDAKRKENIRKHGIDFLDVPSVFDVPTLRRLDKRESYGEDRWVLLGFLGPGIVVVVYTERGHEVIRIISARKANRHERKQFEKGLPDRLDSAG
jgi:uncharacterized DUF497 family protein